MEVKAPNNYKSHSFAVLFALVLGLLFLLYQTRFPPCCDAEQYLGLGALYSESSIAAKSTDASVRTYLYPLIIGYLIKVSNIVQLPVIFVLFAFQFSLYVYAVYKFASAVTCQHLLLKNPIFGAALFNLYVYPYFSLTLTDSLYTSLTIFWLYAAVRFFSSTAAGGLWKSSMLGLVAAACFMVRPAGIWVLVLTAGIYIWMAVKQVDWTSGLRLMLIGFSAIFVPLVPQIYINLLNYGVASPFPVFKLGAAQIQWGIENLKYATFLGGGNPQMFYRNPFYESGNGLQWYFDNPLLAVYTLTLKLIGAFDFDYIFPYIYDKQPWYRWITGFVSESIFFLGCWGMLLHAFKPSELYIKIGPRFFPLFCFMAWASVSLASAIELRFTLPILAVLLPLSVERLFFLGRVAFLNDSKLKPFFVVACVIVLVFSTRYIRAQNVLLG